MLKTRVVGFAGLFVLALLLAGCGSSPAATVNGQTITKTQVAQEQHIQVLFAGSHGKGIPAQTALQGIVDRTLLLQAAKAHNFKMPAGQISQTQSYVRNVLAGQLYPSRSAYQARLGSLSLSQNQVDAYVADASTAHAYLLQAAGGIHPTKGQIAAYYNTHQSQFVTPPQDEAYHILVSSRSLAEKLLGELKGLHGSALLTEFETLARANSKDPGSAKKGGYLGWLKPGQTVPSFNKALFSLRAGQLSGVVHSRFGYHIILVTAVKPAGEQSLAGATGSITGLLQNQAVLNGLRTKAKIKYFSPYKG